MSFSVEQLGFGAGEALPGPVLQPPPVYPPMENRPIPLQTSLEGEYMMALKRDFVEFLRDSPAFVTPVATKADIERYSDRYQVALANKNHGELKFDWTRFPTELRPQAKLTGKRRKLMKNTEREAKLAKKPLDIANRLYGLLIFVCLVGNLHWGVVR
jgi:DNA-directed RNA polymerase III subunit RPC7